MASHVVQMAGDADKDNDSVSQAVFAAQQAFAVGTPRKGIRVQRVNRQTRRGLAMGAGAGAGGGGRRTDPSTPPQSMEVSLTTPKTLDCDVVLDEVRRLERKDWVQNPFYVCSSDWTHVLPGVPPGTRPNRTAAARDFRPGLPSYEK
jgi:hypothetical protein